jgi:hypothetical protein
MEHIPVQILTVAKTVRLSLHVMESEIYDHVHKILSVLHSLNLMSRVVILSV